jgi:hypothetical protein
MQPVSRLRPSGRSCCCAAVMLTTSERRTSLVSRVMATLAIHRRQRIEGVVVCDRDSADSGTPHRARVYLLLGHRCQSLDLLHRLVPWASANGRNSNSSPHFQWELTLLRLSCQAALPPLTWSDDAFGNHFILPVHTFITCFSR